MLNTDWPYGSQMVKMTGPQWVSSEREGTVSQRFHWRRKHIGTVDQFTSPSAVLPETVTGLMINLCRHLHGMTALINYVNKGFYVVSLHLTSAL